MISEAVAEVQKNFYKTYILYAIFVCFLQDFHSYDQSHHLNYP